MQLVPAPARHFKTWSMWLLILAGLIDLAVFLVKTLTDAHVVTVETLAIANAVLAFLTGAVRLIQQEIAMTAEEKIDTIAVTAAQPMKPGEPDIDVQVNGTPLPAADPASGYVPKPGPWPPAPPPERP